MPAVSRVGVDTVSGVAVITGPGAPTVFVNDLPISTVFDTVSAHGEPPHTTPIIVTGSPTVYAVELPITLQAVSIASCGHPVATGSPTVYANN